MKTILWKEWKENLRWALLGLIGLALAEGYALAQVAYGEEATQRFQAFHSICSEVFLMATMFGCPVVGLALGLLQTMPERSPNRWAFLVHRPLSGTGLFLGKVLAGLSLYLLATVPPFLGAAAWAAWPGHIDGPFVPGMMVPGLMDIVAGTAWYLAGMLVGLRDAKWWGTRLLPLGAAWFVSVTVTKCWIVGDGIGYSCWIDLALSLAAWGAWCGNGQDEAQPRLGKLALFVTLALGGYAVIFYGGEFAYVPLFEKQGRAIHYEYRAGNDGNPYIAVYPAAAESYFTDLAGNVMKGAPFDRWQTRQPFLTEDIRLGDGRTAWPVPRYNSYRWIGHYVVFNDVVRRYRTVPGGWFYLPGERRFAQYSSDTGLLRARLGADGLKRPDEPCAPFPEPLVQIDDHSFLFPHAAYSFNEWTSEAVLLAKTDADHPFYDISGLPRDGDPRNNIPGAFAVTDDRQISFFGPDGTLQASTPHLHDIKAYRYIYAGRMNDNGFVLWYWKGWRHDQPGYLDRIDSAGHRMQETVLPPLVDKESPRFWWADANQYLRPFLTVVYDRTNRVGQAWCGSDSKRWQKGWLERTLKNPGDELTYLWRSIGWGLGCAVFALAWAGFSGTPKRRALWGVLGVLGFGPGAVPAFLALCPWIGFERCRVCGEKCRRDADICPHCQDPDSTPAPIGTEIFELPDQSRKMTLQRGQGRHPSISS